MSAPPSPQVRYPDFPAPPELPGPEQLALEASVVLPEQNSPTNLGPVGSWTRGDRQDGTSLYTMRFRLPQGLDADMTAKLTTALKTGVDVTLTLTTPNDPVTQRRFEIPGTVKLKTP